MSEATVSTSIVVVGRGTYTYKTHDYYYDDDDMNEKNTSYNK